MQPNQEPLATYTEPAKTKAKLTKMLVVAALLLTTLVSIWWWFNTSTIVVNVANGSADSGMTYSFLNQESGKTTALSSSASSLTRRVHKGTYEIQVIQGSRSYFSIIETAGFLHKSTLSAKLSEGKSRTFVGNNPGSCMNYSGGVLLSYTCGANYSSINIHQPATAQLPTYTTTNTGVGISGYIQGFAELSGQTIALIQHPSIDVPAYYSFDSIKSDLTLVNETRLPSLDAATSYTMQNYNGGLLVYSSDFKQIFYYAIDSAPKAVKMAQPTKSNVSPISLSVSGQSIVTLYSSSAAQTHKAASQVIVQTGAQSQVYNFSDAYASAHLCGSDNLCLLGGKKLSVYSISSGKPSLKFNVYGVASMLDAGSSFLVVNQTGVLNLHAGAKNGFYEYIFGDYRFNAIQPSTGGYVISLTNNKSNKVALYVNRDSVDIDNIDQKIERLQKQSFIQSVSVYGNYIYVSPDLGQLTFQPSDHSYGYSPDRIAKVNAQIKTEVKKLGIDTLKYRIINSYAE